VAASVVQSALLDYNSGTTLALGSNTTAGNALIAIVLWSYSPTPPSCSDTQGNTWTRHSAITAVSNNAWYCFTAAAKSSAACTITVTGAAGLAKLTALVEASGLASGPFDVQNDASNSSSPVNAGMITPSGNGELILATWCRNGIGASYSNSGVFNLIQTTNSNALASYVQSTAAGITPAVNGSAGGYTNYGYCVALTAAAASGHTPHLLTLGVG